MTFIFIVLSFFFMVVFISVLIIVSLIVIQPDFWIVHLKEFIPEISFK